MTPAQIAAEYREAIDAIRLSKIAQRVEYIGDHVLILGDCREILPTLGKVDCVVTDPPYGIGLDYGAFEDTQANVMALALDWVPMARQCASRVVFTPGNINQHSYPRPDWTMAWVTPAGSGSGPWGFSCWQPIMCYGKDPMLANGKGRAPDIIQHTETSEQNGHPCPKPVRFMQRLLDRVSLAGETILDPFMGSGTTGVACAKLGRKFIGIEIEPRYFDIACKRVQAAVNEPRLPGLDQPKPTQEALL